jgi:hypothetical protein
MGLLEQVIEKLKTLPPEQLAAAAAYIHRLVVPERGKRRALLQDAGGVLTSEEAEALEQALRDCRRIDPGEW